jgi:hypothetical protein
MLLTIQVLKSSTQNLFNCKNSLGFTNILHTTFYNSSSIYIYNKIVKNNLNNNITLKNKPALPSNTIKINLFSKKYTNYTTGSVLINNNFFCLRKSPSKNNDNKFNKIFKLFLLKFLYTKPVITFLNKIQYNYLFKKYGAVLIPSFKNNLNNNKTLFYKQVQNTPNITKKYFSQKPIYNYVKDYISLTSSNQKNLLIQQTFNNKHNLNRRKLYKHSSSSRSKIVSIKINNSHHSNLVFLSKYVKTFKFYKNYNYSTSYYSRNHLPILNLYKYFLKINSLASNTHNNLHTNNDIILTSLYDTNIKLIYSKTNINSKVNYFNSKNHHNIKTPYNNNLINLKSNFKYTYPYSFISKPKQKININFKNVNCWLLTSFYLLNYFIENVKLFNFIFNNQNNLNTVISFLNKLSFFNLKNNLILFNGKIKHNHNVRISNILPEKNFNKVFFKKVYTSFIRKKLNTNFIPIYYITLIRFIEYISGRNTFL